MVPGSLRTRTCAAGGLLVLAAVVCLAACRPGHSPKVVSAELIDDRNPDGAVRAGERIRITLDGPMPKELRAEEVKAWCSPPHPPVQLVVKAIPRPRSNVIELELLTSPPPLAPTRWFGKDPEATGIGVDLGSLAPGLQWVDLQARRPYPVLLQAIWEDRPADGAPGGNLVVDRGDWIRLVFDREVRIVPPSGSAAGPDGLPPPCPVRVPEDVILASPDDQLDDGAVPSVFEDGSSPREVKIVLGSNPHLTVAGLHRSARDRSRSAPFVPSGLAVNGTPVEPMARIVDRRGLLVQKADGGMAPGAVSRGPVDIEFPPGYSFFEKRPEEPFPPPGHRSHPTVTPILAGKAGAVVAGGSDAKGAAISQVLLFNPENPRPVQVLGQMEEGRYLHTATLIEGPEEEPGPPRETIILAGGTDGTRSLPNLIAVKLDPFFDDRASVETVEDKLRWPRMYHTATFLPPRYLFLDGGLYSAPSGGSGIIPKAELLELETRGEKTAVRRRWELETTPRMRHTTTYLGKDGTGAHCLLSYGGIGMPGSAEGPKTGTEERVNPVDALVLAAPELIRIVLPPAAGGEPVLERIELDFSPWCYEKLRSDHRAVPVGFDPLTVQGDAPRPVLIAGGTIQHPYADPNRPRRNLFQPPSKQDAKGLEVWANQKPLSGETAAALVFEFHPGDPKGSVFTVVPSPTGDRRVHLAVVPLPRLGALILGGERPESRDDFYVTGEVYLEKEKRLAPLAMPLTVARSRSGAFAVEGGGGVTVYVVGGASTPAEAGAFTDIERLRIEGQ